MKVRRFAIVTAHVKIDPQYDGDHSWSIRYSAYASLGGERMANTLYRRADSTPMITE